MVEPPARYVICHSPLMAQTARIAWVAVPQTAVSTLFLGYAGRELMIRGSDMMEAIGDKGLRTYSISLARARQGGVAVSDLIRKHDVNSATPTKRHKTTPAEPATSRRSRVTGEALSFGFANA
jgi:hypothetical protein